MKNLENEVWKDIAGYEGYYQVSNFGNVRSLDREDIRNNGVKRNLKGKLMNPRLDKDGYIVINFCKEGIKKTHKIHRLVAIAFLPNPSNLPEVNHKDEDKKNNYVNNLEWCSTKYNINYGSRNERSAQKRRKKVNQFSKEGNLINTFNSIREASIATGIDEKWISNCYCKKQKTAGGYIWKSA